MQSKYLRKKKLVSIQLLMFHNMLHHFKSILNYEIKFKYNIIGIKSSFKGKKQEKHVLSNIL